ncbi:MAG TPA: hypothetical protein PKW18_13755 [Candidatus Sumerlaeota bacterium]|nr:hypothetical protein [Candidatus Sumerlaeota bacterium]HPL75619.1 hypothetical protein [Candidatus Sumerlaeota bacterium]HRR31273.1 hypothetical protein [Candidatus Sumerlaeia bacterium]
MAEELHQGYWYELGKEGQEIPIICCDCGLTHIWQFTVEEDGTIMAKCRIDKRLTARIRRRGEANLFGKSTEYYIDKVRNKTEGSDNGNGNKN